MGDIWLKRGFGHCTPRNQLEMMAKEKEYQNVRLGGGGKWMVSLGYGDGRSKGNRGSHFD